jgi:nitric oxide reductase
MHQRSMVEPFFTKEHINSMRPQIQKIVNLLLDEMIKGGGSEPVDLVEKFALPVPSYVILISPISDSC